MKNNKILKSKPLLFLSISIVIFTISGTFAYFYQEVKLPNEFQSMYYNVDLQENFNGDWGTKEVSFINTDERNVPVVLRINYNEFWNKMDINDSHNNSMNEFPASSDSSEIETPNEFLSEEDYNNMNFISNTVEGENVVLKEWTDAFTNDFVLGNDGWYYYKKILNAQESVKVLNSINLNLEILKDSPLKQFYTNSEIVEDTNGQLTLVEPNELSNISIQPYNYYLIFSFEAIQANKDAILDIWGKNVIFNDDDINWNL